MNKTNILILDVENSPNVSYTWGKYEQNVIDFQKEWYMLSFAHKWLGDKTTKAHALPDFKGYKGNKTNDKLLLKQLWLLLDKADIVIGHNVDRFDLRKINARFLQHGFPPPAPYKTVDTLKIARKYFFLNSNKLGHIGKYLGIGSKIDTGGFDLWLSCMGGDMTAWKKMVKYNKNDVALTERVYLELLPWISNHPNVNSLTGVQDACPKCGAKDLQRRGFSIMSGGRKRQKMQCMSCAGWSQGKIEKHE